MYYCAATQAAAQYQPPSTSKGATRSSYKQFAKTTPRPTTEGGSPPLYGWPVRVSAESTCGVGCVWGDPPLVVGLGVVLVECLEALRVAPSEVLGGKY